MDLSALADVFSDEEDAVLFLELMDDSDDEMEPPPKKMWGGSRPGKAPNQDRQHVMYDALF